MSFSSGDNRRISGIFSRITALTLPTAELFGKCQPLKGRSQDVVLDLPTLPLASGVWVVDDFPKMSVQVTEVTGVDAPGSIV